MLSESIIECKQNQQPEYLLPGYGRSAVESVLLLPHYLIRNQRVDLIENTFRREDFFFICPAMRNILFSLPKNIKSMIYGLVKK